MQKVGAKILQDRGHSDANLLPVSDLDMSDI